MTLFIQPTDAFLLIDLQNDFCPGGSLAVPGGDEIVPGVNRLLRRFPHVVVTQDWHPAGHASFASTHGMKPFEVKTLAYGEQTLWPDHCVQGSKGAAFHPALDLGHIPSLIQVRKGWHDGIDSYSAFYENDLVTSTGLSERLRQLGVRRLVLAGLALDFCVAWSAIDARKEDFDVVVLEDLCRAIDLNGSLAAARATMRAAGVLLASSRSIA